MHNNKKLNILLILVLLSAQMMSLLHMAEHGFAEHEHNGHICELYLYGGQSDSVVLAAPPPLHAPDYMAYVPVFPELSIIAPRVTGNFQVRAPPVFS